jgi:spore coat protein U-like protein
MYKKFAGIIAATGLLLAVSGAGWSATVSDTFDVKLKINKNCTVDAIADMTFADQTFLQAPVTATSSVTVNCTKGTNATVTMSGTGGSRTMSNTVDTITYDLYSDAGYTTYWDSATGVTIGGAGVNASGTTLDASTTTGTTRTIYGRVPAQSTKTTGDYSATVMATVTF